MCNASEQAKTNDNGVPNTNNATPTNTSTTIDTTGATNTSDGTITNDNGNTTVHDCDVGEYEQHDDENNFDHASEHARVYY